MSTIDTIKNHLRAVPLPLRIGRFSSGVKSPENSAANTWKKLPTNWTAGVIISPGR